MPVLFFNFGTRWKFHDYKSQSSTKFCICEFRLVDWKYADVDKQKTTYAVMKAMKKSECDIVVSGQMVSISDTERSAASCSTGKKAYFPVV